MRPTTSSPYLAVPLCPAWDEPDVGRTFLGAAVGYASAIGITALAGMACWEGCHGWGPAFAIPFAVLPALGAHDGSGRRGRLAATLSVSAATVAAGFLIAGERTSARPNSACRSS